MEDKLISQRFLGSPQSWPRSKRKAKEVLVAVNFRVPFEFRQRMKLSAAVRGITMTELMTAALEHYIGNVPEIEGSSDAGSRTHVADFFAAEGGSRRE